MQFQTLNTLYTLTDCGDGAFLISGNARFCPEPIKCTLRAAPEPGERVSFTLLEGHYRGQEITTTPIEAIFVEL